MTELQKLAEMNDVATGAAVGGGVGAAGGLLTALIKKKPTLRKSLKSMLIGSASGAAIGGGTMALKKISEGDKQPEGTKAPESTAAAAEAPKKEPKHMDMTSAAKHGLLPIAGAAIQGHEAGGGLQALISGGSSAGGMAAGAAGGTLLDDLLQAKGKKTPAALIPAALATLGSVGGSMGAAHMFNEREKAAGAEDIGRSIDQATGDLGGINISPLSGMGGAAVGGTAGAGLGAGAGLLKALFDSEDDGVLSTLGKTLSGGAAGGLVGAGVGALGSNHLRGRVMSKVPFAGDPGSKRHQVADETLKRFVMPVKSLFNKATGQIDTPQFNKEVGNANAQESVMHALAPLILRSASRPDTRTVTQE